MPSCPPSGAPPTATNRPSRSTTSHRSCSPTCCWTPCRPVRPTVITTASDAASLGHLDLDDLENAGAFDTKKAYATSKLHNILFTRELQRRYGDRGISTVAFHPGNVASNFASDTTSNWRFVYGTPLRHIALISPEKGTRTLLWLVNGTPGTTWTPGLFYIGNKTKIPNPQAADDELAAGLWTRSAELAGLPTTHETRIPGWATARATGSPPASPS